MRAELRIDKHEDRVLGLLWTLDGQQALAAFALWLEAESRAGVKLVVIDGLQGSGKSTLIASVDGGIDLDSFLPLKRTGGQTPWTHLVIAGGAVDAVRAALLHDSPVVVGGAAAWPVLKSVAESFAASEVKRVYLKRVKVYGDYVCWDDGQGLLDHAARSNAYFRSIYEYHGSEEPWATADLVIQRTEEV